MPVLKIRKNGEWVEVWGATNDTNVSAPKSTSINLLAANWVGETQPYSQGINISVVTANSKIDLQPTAAQIVELQDAEITLMVENNNGVLTCYALGNKPTSDYIMQALITEVVPI